MPENTECAELNNETLQGWGALGATKGAPLEVMSGRVAPIKRTNEPDTPLLTPL